MEQTWMFAAGYLLIAVFGFFAGTYGYIREEKKKPNYKRERTLNNIKDVSFMVAVCCLLWPIALGCTAVIVVSIKIIEFLERIA